MQGRLQQGQGITWAQFRPIFGVRDEHWEVQRQDQSHESVRPGPGRLKDKFYLAHNWELNHESIKSLILPCLVPCSSHPFLLLCSAWPHMRFELLALQAHSAQRKSFLLPVSCLSFKAQLFRSQLHKLFDSSQMTFCQFFFQVAAKSQYGWSWLLTQGCPGSHQRIPKSRAPTNILKSWHPCRRECMLHFRRISIIAYRQCWLRPRVWDL